MKPYTTKYEDKTEDEKKVIALAKFLCQGMKYTLEELPEEEREGMIEEAKKAIEDYDYEVYTDEEADEKWEEALDNYLDECVYPELPENMRFYFDDEKWKMDARFDGRGHSLSRYDGVENYEEVDRGTYYIYRQN